MFAFKSLTQPPTQPEPSIADAYYLDAADPYDGETPANAVLIAWVFEHHYFLSPAALALEQYLIGHVDFTHADPEVRMDLARTSDALHLSRWRTHEAMLELTVMGLWGIWCYPDDGSLTFVPLYVPQATASEITDAWIEPNAAAAQAMDADDEWCHSCDIAICDERIRLLDEATR